MISLILIILLLIMFLSISYIVFGEPVLDGSYCATEDGILEYCLVNYKVTSCYQNMTACIEANKELEQK